MDFNRHLDIKKLAILLWLFALDRPALAQFIGFTSPQSVQQILGTPHQTCGIGGAAQTFTIQNLGQTEHFLTIAADTPTTQFTVNLAGVDVTGTQVNIGDQVEMAGIREGSLFASGYYPKEQVIVSCAPATATYTLTYSGIWGTPSPSGTGNNLAGNFLQTQVDKEIANGVSGTGGFNHGVIPPFGDAGGVLIFRFISGGAASTVSLNCTTQTAQAQTWTQSVNAGGTPIANNTTQQAFIINSFPCPQLLINFSGAPGSLFYLAYLFITPGSLLQTAIAQPSFAPLVPGAGKPVPGNPPRHRKP